MSKPQVNISRIILFGGLLFGTFLLVLLLLILDARFPLRFSPKSGDQKSLSNRSSDVLSSNPTAQSSTLTWKTYTSKEAHYSIQYPPDYRLVENSTLYSGSEKFTRGEKSITISPPPDLHLNFSILIVYATINWNTSLEEVIDDLGACAKLSSDKYKTPQGKLFILDGKDATIFEDTNCGLFGASEIYAVNGERGYEISIESTAVYAQHKQYVEPILSTFKFTQ